MIYEGEEGLDKLRKSLFELESSAWDLEIVPELRGNFIQKVDLQVEIKARRSEEIDWFSYEVSYHYKDLSFTYEELNRFLPV